ncbi:hypothetical protein BDY21DRAFT_103380 [Lineolata rhizophorae]|uniref:BHLH domain-containing protein n=1 Tax=Lineolata rhizophorae TaxID=578093 RepID=A0A6A6NRK0_9PEZI|nr:hypothetical protein BDY21DRAFT_103380 [Lineolata rhizophorae]
MHQNGGPVNNPSDAATAAAALSHYSMTVPQPTEMSFQAQSSTGEGDRPMSASFGMGDHQHGGHGLNDFPNLDALKSPTRQANESNTGIHAKPAVGSEEWHKQRRDNHKEVERRRRETINEGINELAKIVPGCEKNKGSILQRAVQFITQLKENEQANIEKWTLEKLLTEQAITELSNSCEKLKSDCQRAWDEKEAYRRACEKHGIVPEEFQNQGENADKNGEN